MKETNDFTYVVTADDSSAGYDIKSIIRREFHFSSRLMGKIKRNHCVYLNGQSVPGWITPKPGDTITVVMPEEKSNFPPQDIPISVVYEDEDMLVIDKQPGYIVHPTASHPEDTIANGIAKYCIDTNQSFKLRFVNRLDRDTSGLLVIGKNSHCQNQISQQMKTDKVEKIYTALVHGIIDEEEGTIDLPIGRPNEIGIKRKVMPNGAPCVTHYKVLKRFFPKKNSISNPLDRSSLDMEQHKKYLQYKDEFLKAHPDKQKLYEYLAAHDEANDIVHEPGFTLLSLKLETGRTHQIRVHVSYIGHPIVGDTLYGGASDIISRQALHASQLSLNQPVTGKRLSFEAPLPEDINKALEQI